MIRPAQVGVLDSLGRSKMTVIRIMTGAPLPKGADSVVREEVN